MDQRTFAYCDCQTGWQTFAVFFAVGRGITRPSGRRLPFFAVGRGIARPSGRRLPFFAVADQSSSVTVTLWEDSVNSLKQYKSYRLNNFVVREYASVKYLSIARSDCTIEDIADIGEVKDTQDPKEDLTKINHVRIVGVPQLDKYKACLRCKGRVEPCSPPLGR